MVVVVVGVRRWGTGEGETVVVKVGMRRVCEQGPFYLMDFYGGLSTSQEK